MGKKSKAYVNARQKIEEREYQLDEAVTLLKEIKSSKFDESIDVSMRLGVDPKYPDQMVRGTVVLPHGTGKVKRVLVVASGEKQKEAEDAQADYVFGEEVVDKIQKENFFDYEVVVATPDMMKHLGRLGKVLGPKGLMPSPKAGTVTFNLKDTIEEIKKGRIEFKVDKTGIINSSVAKISFDETKIADNIKDFVGAVMKAKPVALKGKYVRTIYLSSTMSPSIKLNAQEFEK